MFRRNASPPDGMNAPLRLASDDPRLLDRARAVLAEAGIRVTSAPIAADEETLDAFFQDAADALLMVSHAGRVLAANPAACAMFASSEHELRGCVLGQLQPSGTTEALLGTVAEGVVRLRSLEAEWIDRVGRRFPVIATATPLPGGERLLMVLRDQGAARRVETVLREREHRFRQLARIAADWLWDLDTGLRFTRVEGRLLERTGMEARALITLCWHDLVDTSAADGGGWAAMREALRVHKAFDEVELVVSLVPGMRHHLRVSGTPLLDDDGGFVGYRGSARDVTEQESAKRARTESENQFRAVFDHAATGIVLVDLEGVMRRCNAAFCQLLGYSADELLGRHFGDVTHPDDRTETVDRFPEPALLVHGKLEIEKRYLRRDGGVVWTRVTASLARDASGQPAFVVGMVDDVTNRRAMHEALWRSEQSLRLVIDNSPAAIHFKDRDGRLLLVNRRLCEWFGMRASQIVGQPARRWLDETLATCIEAEERRVLEGAVSVLTHHALVCADGEQRMLEMLKFPIFDEAGVVVGVGGIDTDVTERLHAEEALRDSEERFRQLVEHLDEGIVVWEVEGGEAIYSNPACSMITELDVRCLSLRLASGLECLHPDDREHGRDSRERALRGEASDVEYRLLRGDGELRWMWERTLPVRNAQGAVYRVIGIFKDITALKQAEQQRLQRVREQRDTLLREVHHRIKNALQGIVGLLRRHADQSPALKDVLEHALQQLDAVGVVYGSYSGQPSLVRLLEALVGGAGPRWRWQALSGDAGRAESFQLVTDEAVPVALVVSELLTNALKHGGDAVLEEGGEVLVSQLDGGLAVEVRHPAPPLPAGFDFERGCGTGTGLELVRALLPPRGASLGFHWADGTMTARLELRAPVLVEHRTE